MTDTDLKIRGLCEALAGANASAAECCRALSLIAELPAELRLEFVRQEVAHAGNVAALIDDVLPRLLGRGAQRMEGAA
ncbi:MAG: hypothetical protein HC834_09615 [Rhodospirillales bacterium]|nr:hypothetical protein [Rhodospirillales bacterium]